jgi:hypothetical protein
VLDTTEELASDVNREVIRPVLDAAEEGASTVNREVIRPVLDAAEEGASTVNRELIQPAIDATADTVREIGRDIREAIPDVDLPDVNLPDVNLPDVNLPDLPDLPDVDLPDVDLPDVDLSRLLGLLGGPTSTGIANPGMYTPEETALVELGELFDLDALTLSGALEDEKLRRLNYNQGGIVSYNNVEDLIRLLRG